MTDLSDAHTAMPSLKGKRVIITGGTTGIGRAIAVLLASEGARVFICGRSDEHLADALARIREVGEGDGITLDLSHEASPKAFVAAGKAYLGGVDVSVINAAIAAEGLSDMSEEEVRYAIATNFTGYLMTAHASIPAHVLGPNSTVYAGIKYGIQGFAEAFRREMGPKGVRVSLVEPGLTGSTMQEPESPPEKQREKIRDETSLRAEDIAVGVQYILTQPRRTVIQQLTISPRNQDSE
jgi:NADP-dependent 3-hydroxy acid dehydrogenase YdfG